MSDRLSVPTEIQSQVLIQSGRRCCICFGLNQDRRIKLGQIAHIDGDAGNNAIGNLAFLCLEHHDQYDSSSSQSKGITEAELLHYREGLYADLKSIPCVSADTPLKDSCLAPESPTQEQPYGPGFLAVGEGIIQVGGDLKINTREVHRTTVTPGPEHIRESDAYKIREVVKQIANIDITPGGKPSFGKWYQRLCKKFRVTSYKLVPAERAAEAIAWLQQQRAMLQPKLRRKSNPAWRKNKYTGIYSRAKELGLSHSQVHVLANERLDLRKPISSLTELCDRDLERLYNIVFSLPR
jgi:hypothetical protein